MRRDKSTIEIGNTSSLDATAENEGECNATAESEGGVVILAGA